MTRGNARRRIAHLVRFELDEDGDRWAVITCPFCGEHHKHVMPLDVLPYATPERSAPCGGFRAGEYIINLRRRTADELEKEASPL
jgi:hypothetical protein